ncbi:hypothetical protein RU93_GL000432 [Enterococcus aquimarinus]|uniref:Uncharacterized protein n=1 Tax=Enterococcus aquimarinus TaxID=328396 RepID=A0A1L8QR41_9ENTE|nr:hypothetical protein RU93_GL000432 [Enterococcus aquimarinus]
METTEKYFGGFLSCAKFGHLEFLKKTDFRRGMIHTGNHCTKIKSTMID